MNERFANVDRCGCSIPSSELGERVDSGFEERGAGIAVQQNREAFSRLQNKGANRVPATQCLHSNSC